MFHYRDDMILVDHLLGDAFDNFLGDLVGVQIQSFHAVLLSQHHEQFIRIHIPQCFQSLNDILRTFAFRYFLPAFGYLFIGDHPVFQQQFQYKIIILCHQSTSFDTVISSNHKAT